MKMISSLAIALLAIFSILTSANISPVAFDMVANVAQYSVATSEFRSSSNYDEGANQGQVAFFFPGHFPPSSVAYKNLDCTTVISLNNLAKFAVIRSTVTRSNDPSGFTRVNHNLTFRKGQMLGNFKTACSFIAPETPRGVGTAAHSSVAVGSRIATKAEYNTMIRNSNSIIGDFSAYISDKYNMGKPSTFKISNINKMYAYERQFIIRNPSAKEATTGSIMSFATYGSYASCDVHWDGVLYPESGQVEALEAGKYLRVTLGSPLNAAFNIIIQCRELRGTAFAAGFYGDNAKFFPTTLEFAYGLKKAFTVASTPSYPSTAEFETGFTTLSSFPFFTPESLIE